LSSDIVRGSDQLLAPFCKREKWMHISERPSCEPPNQAQRISPLGSCNKFEAWTCTVEGGTKFAAK
jgi:hypothetical protein